ncbi:MAG: hypothetical protein ABIH39_01895 [Candidatus Margulisiibacteriota bacterium]
MGCGTKDCSAPACSPVWTPAATAGNTCEGTTVTQTNQCNSNTNTVIGEKDCTPPSINSFYPLNNPGEQGYIERLYWTVSDATSCVASGKWNGSKSATGGTYSFWPYSSSVGTYTLTCSKLGFSNVSSSILLGVWHPAKTSVCDGEIFTQDDGLGHTRQRTGTYSGGVFSPVLDPNNICLGEQQLQSNTCTSQYVTGTNPALCGQPPVILSFTASETSITSGDITTLIWDSSDADSCSISDIGPVLPSGSVPTIPLTTTTYILTCIKIGFPDAVQSLDITSTCASGYDWDGDSCEPVICSSTSDCDDGNACTIDNCLNPGVWYSSCEKANVANGTENCSGCQKCWSPDASTESVCSDWNSACPDDNGSCGDPVCSSGICGNNIYSDATVCDINSSCYGGSCTGDSRDYTCPQPKPEPGTIWNTAPGLYTQTWNGGAWTPIDDAITEYNTAPSPTSCRYDCDTDYVWDVPSSTCKSDNTLPSVSGMTAPNWSFQQAKNNNEALKANLDWIYSDDSSSDATAYQIIVNTSNSTVSPLFDSGECFGYNNPTNKCKIDVSSERFILDSAILDYDTSYYWWIKVWDDQNTASVLTQYNTNISGHALTDNLAGNLVKSSDPNLTFTTYKHEMPIPSAIYSPAVPNPGQEVQFTNTSKIYLTADPTNPVSYSGNCFNASCSLKWIVPAGAIIDDDTSANPIIIFNSTGATSVTLKVTDNDGYYSESPIPVNVKDKLPNWEEVKPE